MSDTTDLRSVIRTLVAAEVQAALEPFRPLFNRMSALLGEARVGSSARIQKAKPNRARPSGAHPVALAAKIELGQTVQYRQGRGTFDAVVIALDADAGTAQLRRSSDGKEVVRPMEKVLVTPMAKTEAAVALSVQREAKGLKRRLPSQEKASAEPLPAFDEGALVSYRQGRGVVEARVVRTDRASGEVVLEKVKNGERVLRPASKLSPVAAAAPVVAPVKPTLRRRGEVVAAEAPVEPAAANVVAEKDRVLNWLKGEQAE